MTNRPTILMLCGGLRSSTRIHRALAVLADRLEERGVRTRWFCLGDHPLPILDPAVEPPTTAEWLIQEVAGADAVVVGGPEYHAAPSGGLKNLIDHLTRPLLEDKPVGLVVTAGGDRGGVNALNGLRLIFRSLHADVVPEQAIVTAGDFGPADDLEPGPGSQHLASVADGLVRALHRRRDRS